MSSQHIDRDLVEVREVIVEHLEEEIRFARVVVEATSKELKLPVDEVRRPAAPRQRAPPPRAPHPRRARRARAARAARAAPALPRAALSDATPPSLSFSRAPTGHHRGHPRAGEEGPGRQEE
jgi:hypothetical protein